MSYETKLTDFIKSLNPKPEDQAILVYGSKYKLWRGGEYLGVATWSQDDNVGDSFQRETNIDGYAVTEIVVADTWELIINKL